MSMDYSLVCDDCEVSYFAGQDNYLYSIEALAEFLYAHVGHNLSFINGCCLDKSDGYTRFTPEEGN